MPPWQRKRTCKPIEDRSIFDGDWVDIGEGSCRRCTSERRLYQPFNTPKFAVCASCSQIYAKASLGNEDRTLPEYETGAA